MRIDTDSSVDQATDARTLMTVQIGTATGREGHAVPSHEQFALRQRFKEGSEFFVRNHARRIGCRAALIATRELPAPASNAALAWLDSDRGFALPGLAIAQHMPANFGRAVRDEDEARQCRQAEHGFVGA